MLKIKEEKWKEFCKTSEAFGFVRIAPDVYGTHEKVNAVRIDKSGICLIVHLPETKNITEVKEDYGFKNGFPKNVIKLIEAGYVQFPELA